jgi:uncharacterized membrane protein
MTTYLAVKLLHILSATILFGTGLGTAFFLFSAWRSDNFEAMRVTARTVVLADWLFTTPAVVIQFLTGLWLTSRLGIPYGSLWFVTVMALFVLVGACWIPVVGIQIRLRNLLRTAAPTPEYHRLMRLWVSLGIPAFVSVVILFALMVYRPWVGRLVIP